DILWPLFTAPGCLGTRGRTLRFLFCGWLAATGGRDGSLVRMLQFRFSFGLCGRLLFLIHLFFNLEIFFLRPASLPTILPVTDQEVEAIGVNLHAWLEAYAKIAVVHLVLVNV